MKKYGNKKVIVDNIKFDSKMEADYYYMLKIKKAKREIYDFEVHKKVEIQPKFKFNGQIVKPVTYTPDFVVYNNDNSIDYIDVKGVKTNEFKLKEKMFKYLMKDYINVNIYCVKLHNETWVTL